MKPLILNRFLIKHLFATICITSSAYATDRTWTGATNSDWLNAGNWGGTVPGATDRALFGTLGSPNPTTTSSGNVLTLQIRFNAGGASFSGTNSLKLTQWRAGNGSGGAVTTVEVQTGNTNAQTININNAAAGQNFITIGNATANPQASTHTLLNNGSGLLTIGSSTAGGFWCPSLTAGRDDGILLFDGTGNTQVGGIGSGDLAITDNGSGTGTGRAILGLTKNGGGTLTLTSNNNSYTGVTTINAGTVSVATIGAGGANGNLGAATNSAANLVINGGTLKYTGATASTDRNFTLGTNGGTLDASGTGVLTMTGAPTMSGTNTARTLTLAGANIGANTLQSAIGDNGSGATSLTKDDAGQWVLTNTSTYTGATTVNAGTLVINGNISTSILTTVNSGGIFGGTGSTGALTVALGGTLAPGQGGIESLNVNGALTLAASSFSAFEINTTGDLADLAITSALLTFGGTLNVTNIGGTLQDGDVFNLFDWNTTTGSFSAVNLPGLGGGLAWDQSNLYSNGTIAIIPEPNVAALLGSLGLISMLRRRRF